MGLTREKRIEFVLNIVPLSLWYAQHRTDGSDDPAVFHRILTAQTPIYRLTELWDGRHHPASGTWRDERWETIVRELYNLLRTRPAALEAAGTELLAPLVLARIDTDLRAWPWTPCGYCPYPLPTANVFGVFVWEKVKSASSAEEFISFHVGNAKVPYSPFEDMQQLRSELAALVADVMSRHPEVKNIGCNSWLNSFPRFLSLFPPEWPQRENVPENVSYGYNWWGQFVSRTGGFHFRNAELLRTTGDFPFPACDGCCTLAALHRHLAGNHVRI